MATSDITDSSNSAEWAVWDLSFLSDGSSSSVESTSQSLQPYAIVLLNQPISEAQKGLFERLWCHGESIEVRFCSISAFYPLRLILYPRALIREASVRVCADGGGNRLYKYINRKFNKGQLPLPDAIVGDLDSLGLVERRWFEERKVPIAHRPSQYATDLQKSIQWIEDWEQEQSHSISSHSRRQQQQQLELVIFGGLSGRLDQTAHTLHVLWKLSPGLASGGGYEDPDAEEKRGGQVLKREHTYVVGDGSLVFLLPPGKHRMRHLTPPLGPACGILPFGVQGNTRSHTAATGAKVATRGLEWDVTPDMPQSLGGYLSTSNHVVGVAGEERQDSSYRTVELTTDKPVYWSVEISEEEDDEAHERGTEDI